MVQVTVQGIFDISPQSTIYKIVKGNDEVWSGTELKRCVYRDCVVEFMRYIGNPYEPYEDGYIELKIEGD